MTSSPLTTTAPTSIPSITNPAYTGWGSKIPTKPVVLAHDVNAEFEIYSRNAGQEMYYSTDAPVDVDEALQNDNSATDEPSNQMWVTTTEAAEAGQETGVKKARDTDDPYPAYFRKNDCCLFTFLKKWQVFTFLDSHFLTFLKNISCLY